MPRYLDDPPGCHKTTTQDNQVVVTPFLSLWSLYKFTGSIGSLVDLERVHALCRPFMSISTLRRLSAYVYSRCRSYHLGWAHKTTTNASKSMEETSGVEAGVRGVNVIGQFHET